MIDDRIRRAGPGLLFGAIAPLVCFALDPFFFGAAPLADLSADWPLFQLAPAHSTLAYGTDLLLGLSVLGICLHASGLARALARPLLAVGILFSAFFSVAILPALPLSALLWPLLLPLLSFAPLASLWVQVRAYRQSLQAQDGVSRLRVWAVALLLVGLAFLPHAHYTRAVRQLEQARSSSELATALERLLPYQGLARADLRRIYLDASALKRVRIRNLYYELAEAPLLELIADGRL